MRNPDMLAHADRPWPKSTREHMPTAAQSREAAGERASRIELKMALKAMNAADVIELVREHFEANPPEAEKYGDQMMQFSNEIGRLAWAMQREAGDH